MTSFPSWSLQRKVFTEEKKNMLSVSKVEGDANFRVFLSHLKSELWAILWVHIYIYNFRTQAMMANQTSLIKMKWQEEVISSKRKDISCQKSTKN